MKRILAWLLVAGGLLALAYYAFLAPRPASQLSAVVQSTSAPLSGFARATGPRVFSFPADLGAHPEYQTEWWYYTGNLQTAEGRHFGYQLTFFRRALLPQAHWLPRSSQWATEQIYMAHFTITDVQDQAFYTHERLARGAAGLAGAQAEPYSVWLEDLRVEASGPDQYQLYAASDAVRLQLSLHDIKGPVLQGIEGYSQKGEDPGDASYYYSQTHLETSGQIEIGAQAYRVQGLSWKDHEFSTSVLSDDMVGWDWFSIQLDNDYELMLYQLRRADGSLAPRASGLLVAPDGSTTLLGPGDFSIVPQGRWRSPRSGGVYPARWQLGLPAYGLTLEVSPLLADQELDTHIIYWEGAVAVQGSYGGAPVAGFGYVELTGYAEPFNGDF
ncbi:MAG: hypothetical protein KF828_08065 [Anaerolineales bacterium]|nr:hypothetical protein [Anaerolineales bacterium]